MPTQQLSSRGLFKANVVTLSILFLAPAVAAPGASQRTATGAGKPKVRAAEVLDLPTGHVGQHYETKILGVKGIDIGDASCVVSPELPAGLDLDCERMTIMGRPHDAMDETAMRLTVSDTSGDSVSVDLSLTVIDGPDVVRIGGGRKPLATPVAAPALRANPDHRASMARSAAPSPAANGARVFDSYPAAAPSLEPAGLPSQEPELGPAHVERVATIAPVTRREDDTVALAKAPESRTLGASEAEGNDKDADIYKPPITSVIAVDTTVISGKAKASTGRAKVSVAIVSDDDFGDMADGKDDGLVDGCPRAVDVQKRSDRFLALVQSSGTGAGSISPVDENGSFSVTLKSPLVEGQRLHAIQLDAHADGKCRTKVRVARSPLDWGRIHADFAAGVLISNDSTNSTTGSGTAGSGNFSQAHQFYALSVEKSWSLPGCYIRIESHPHTDQKMGRPSITLQISATTGKMTIWMTLTDGSISGRDSIHTSRPG